MATADEVTLALAGDVMLGRGVDQILPSPGDPTLHETVVRDARTYVSLAEKANGPVPRPVGPDWPWGDALRMLDRERPDARIVNLETSITRSDELAPAKAVRYRMSPDNVPALAAARPDVCVLANNHVLDHGRSGLDETIGVLDAAGLAHVGAGHDLDDACSPVYVEVAPGARVVVTAWGTTSSGIPPGWAAGHDRPGVALLDPVVPDHPTLAVIDRVRSQRRPGDLLVTSIHWGPNWGYDVASSEVELAHALIDRGVDVVHGHSSHHPRPLEVYRGRPILYGCGDLIDDYEGIGGHERFRSDLRVVYLVTLQASTGRLLRLRLHVFQARRMRLERASRADTAWLGQVLTRAGARFGTRVVPATRRRSTLDVVLPVDRSG